MKKFILLLLILVLTGCNAKYEISLDSTGVSENLSIKGLTDGEYSKFDDLWIPVDYEINDYVFFTSKVDGINYYDLSKRNGKVFFDYIFSYENFGNSTLLNNCYNDITFSRDRYEIILKTSNQFLCFDSYDSLDSLEVVIESDYKLLDTNADEVKDNVYKWYIDNSDKGIYLRLDSSYESSKQSFFQKLFNNNFVIFSLLIFCGVLICYLLKKRGDLKNKV